MFMIELRGDFHGSWPLRAPEFLCSCVWEGLPGGSPLHSVVHGEGVPL